MQNMPHDKLHNGRKGFSLVEVLMVVVIMGIISGIGVAGLRSAVANARIKDAAFNLTAFMERTANKARQLNTTLCVKRVTDQKLVVYNSPCSASTVGPKVDSLVFETPTKLVSSTKTSTDFVGISNWFGVGAEFTPRAGLSAAPTEGYFSVQYGGRGVFGATLKQKGKNGFAPMMKHDDGNWFGI